LRLQVLAHLGDLRVVDAAHDVRRNERREDAEDHHDDHDFDQREAAFAAAAGGRPRGTIDLRHKGRFLDSKVK
jgi:hypothetical protein